MDDVARLKRQLRRLQSARQRWKHRAAAKQAEIRRLRVNVRDLANSRELWKQRCQPKAPSTTDAAPAPVLLPGPCTHQESACRGEF